MAEVLKLLAEGADEPLESSPPPEHGDAICLPANEALIEDGPGSL
jgi:hypothetical protein